MATSIQSEPLQELLDLRNESMPYFVMNDNEIQLKNLVTDGQVVRVAIVNVEPDADPAEKADPDLLSVYDAMVSSMVNEHESQNYTPSLERTFPFTMEAARPIYENVEDPRDQIYGGELWLATRNGQIEFWQPLRQSCLSNPRLNGNDFIFDYRLKCNYKKRMRVVAIVYNKRRSNYVRRRAETENVLREFELNPPLNRRVLVDTLSPFVRTTWTSVF